MVPVIENIAAFLEAAINEITVANEFNYTLSASRKKRYFFNDEVFDDLNVYLLQGRTEIKGQGLAATSVRTTKQEYLIWAVALQNDKSDETIDIKLNQIKADILKKLCEDPTCGGYAKMLDVIAIEPTDIPETGVQITIQVTYCTIWNNQYLQA